MSNPIISIESIRRLRLQNTRFFRATSISVVVSPSSAPRWVAIARITKATRTSVTSMPV